MARTGVWGVVGPRTPFPVEASGASLPAWPAVVLGPGDGTEGVQQGRGPAPSCFRSHLCVCTWFHLLPLHTKLE